MKESNYLLTMNNIAITLPTYQLDSAGVPLHSENVDIIVCVHNALPDVQRCLNALITQTTKPYHLIIVDDGSESETTDFLKHYTTLFPITVIRNEEARGYTCAANQGLRAATGSYTILLNSDTLVSPYWLDRLIACANSDDKIGIVGPLSNTASWQSIPKIEERGDWAKNPLPIDFSVDQIANRLAAYSSRIYPRLPFLNGFCLLIKKQVIDSIGYFDEETFGQGYGEENDYCIRARQAGWELAIADDVYIYHAQSKSYSDDRRKKLAEQAGKQLAKKHGQNTIDSGANACRDSRVLYGLRERAKLLLERWNVITEGQYHWQGKRVIFILPIKQISGGGNVVLSEARAMQNMGVEVFILNFMHHQLEFERNHPHLTIPVIYTPNDFDIPRLCQNFDAVIATAYQSVEWLIPLANQPNPPILAYYIQDFEPYFHVDKAARFKLFWKYSGLRRRFASYYFRRGADFRRAWLSYFHIPTMIRFTKTKWNQREVEKQTQKSCALIGASCEVDLFLPRSERENQGKIRITAMIRPSSSRRGGLRTMQVLREIQHNHSDKVDIILFGVEDTDSGFLAFPRDFAYTNLGIQNPQQISEVLNQSDIFVDFSTFQAMGLTAMESMSCGVAVILPESGGGDTFAIHRKNALVVDTFSHQACYQAVEELVNNEELRNTLAHQAIKDISRFYPEKPAYRILELLFPI
jgi:GT2 family glycosyltransferase/glycosyltransferase involved in cell wall biosynthesis